MWLIKSSDIDCIDMFEFGSRSSQSPIDYVGSLHKKNMKMQKSLHDIYVKIWFYLFHLEVNYLQLF